MPMRKIVTNDATATARIPGREKVRRHGRYTQAKEAAERYGVKGNLLAGANLAGFEKVATAMQAQGWV